MFKPVSTPSSRGLFAALFALSLVAAACGTEDAGESPDAGRTTQRDGGVSRDASADDVSPSDAGADTGTDSGTPDDVGGDVPDQEVVPNDCDRDGDGFEDPFCGGLDCDDNDRSIHPDAAERCDEIDNNCNGAVNDGITCSFYAHTDARLYLVDPFKSSDRLVVDDIPNLLDFDTSRDGTLWGISSSALHRFDEDARDWVTAASLSSWPTGPNGFAVASTGTAFATGGDELYEINLDTGDYERVGRFGGGYYSSGDCVTDKSDRLYMSSKRDGQTDQLVVVDARTGVATLIGDIGFRGVYGLTSAWGHLFGLTSSGELIDIDPDTGVGTLWHTFDDRRWYGAASAPDR